MFAYYTLTIHLLFGLAKVQAHSWLYGYKYVDLARNTHIQTYLQALGLMVNFVFTFPFWLYNRSFYICTFG